jgi:hypothetical protein
MAKGSENGSQGSEAVSPKPAKSLTLAAKGVNSSKDFAALMGAIMSDVLSGSLPPDIANAACNAGGKLLKVIEMQHRYGKGGKDDRTLELVEKE